MKAGPALNALIAVEVMKLKPITETFESHHNGDEVTIVKWVDDDGKEVSEYGWCPRYSTSIADAWLVVEKLTFCTLWKQPNGWEVQYRSCGNIMTHIVVDDCCDSAYADTAPLAICLAALKAVGYKEE